VAVQIVVRLDAVSTNKKKTCWRQDEQALQDPARDELSAPYFDADQVPADARRLIRHSKRCGIRGPSERLTTVAYAG
jgi:hypothetical protein